MPRANIYRVRDSVWAAAGIKSFGGCLCIGCLEERLGRRLRPRDVSDAGLNLFSHVSPRFNSRRGRWVPSTVAL